MPKPKDGENADDKNNTGEGKGTNPDNKGTDTKAEFDPKALSDDDFKKVFDDPRLWEHPRFKSLTDDAKEGRKAKEKLDKLETEKAEEEGKYKELYEKEKGKSEQARIDNAIIAAATKAGAVDAETVTKLINRDGLKIGDDGTVEGVEDAVNGLLESKPFLKGDGTGNGEDVSLGSGTNPGGESPTGKFKFKHSQIQDPKFYQENEAEILEAMKNNQIENDLPA